MLIALRQIVRRFHGEEGGAALVEVAIVAPFVLLLSAGVFEFSNILNTRLLLEAGVEDAARYMARCNDSTNCETYAKNLAVNGAITGGSARVSGWDTSQVNVSKSHFLANDGSGNELYLSSASTVDVVQVSTVLPYNGIGFWSYLGFGGIDITVSHQERVFGW
ncbi:pilus assembly protein [Mesorhizobium sp. M0924]|uniref:TadE/TadG family type IV pilus assembly protein n=1 Tax=unclassified Mesorhizobium TaxID=325217 RepID=UPI003336E670